MLEAAKSNEKSLQKGAIFRPQFRPQLPYFTAFSAMKNSQNRVKNATVETDWTYMTG